MKGYRLYSFGLVLALVAMAVPAMARPVFPLSGVSGASADWALGPGNILSFFNTFVELDYDNNAGTSDLYTVTTPQFQVDETSKSYNGLFVSYDVNAVAGNDKLVFYAADGVTEMARFSVENIETLDVLLVGTTASIDAAFGFDLALEYVNPDATPFEGVADYWLDGFDQYLSSGGADYVVTMQIPGGAPSLLISAIDNLTGLQDSSATSASYSLYPASRDVPEPTTMVLVGAGLAAVAVSNRRRRNE